MHTVLVIGASRGIGLALVQHYCAAGSRVIATVRDAEGRRRVQALGAEVHRLDVADPASVSSLAWLLDGEKIDIALYVAGVWSDLRADTPPTQQAFDRVMHTNVLGAMQVLPQVAPLVQAADGVFGLLSSEMSRLSDAGPDAWLYRVSKAALNMVVASSQQPDAVARRPRGVAGPRLGANRHGRRRRATDDCAKRARFGSGLGGRDAGGRRTFAALRWRAPSMVMLLNL